MTSPAGDLRRSALVTGASKGLGLALAGYLASRRYRLVVTARGEEELHAVAGQLATLTEVTAIAGDIGDPRHRTALAEAAGDRLDLLVNNASDLGTSPLPPLVEYDLDRLRQVFETNVVAPLALIQQTVAALQPTRGWVVNISSDAAKGGYPGWGAYGASKAALDLLGLTLAHELTEVTVVNVDPGDMRTAMHQAAYPGADISDRKLPEETLPFWAWLLEQDGAQLDGQRLEAQSEVWELV